MCGADWGLIDLLKMLTLRIVYRMFFLGQNFVSRLMYTKSKKNFKT